MKYSRDQAECDLIFLGFYIVQNKLKEETQPEIEILRKA
jgi:magnesium-transporting ATPase (P-type)